MPETCMARPQKDVHLSGTPKIGLTRDSMLPHMHVSTSGIDTVYQLMRQENGYSPTHLSMLSRMVGTRDLPPRKENTTTPTWYMSLGMMNTPVSYGVLSCATLRTTMWGDRKRGKKCHEHISILQRNKGMTHTQCVLHGTNQRLQQCLPWPTTGGGTP